MNKKYTLLPLLTATLVACGGGGTPSPSNEKPMVSLKRADGSVITTTTYLGAGDRIIVSSSDADGNITKVQWKIDDKAGEFSGTDVKSRLELPPTGLSNGTHTAEVTVTDNAGATATTSTTFNVDAVAPTITSIALNGTRVTNGSTTNLTIGDAASLTVTATDSRGTDAAAFSPATIRIMEGTSVRATGTNTVTADLSKAADGKDRTAGPVTFTIIATDSAGNSTVSTTTLNFTAAGTVDTTKPTFNWLSPSADFVPGNSSVTVRASASRSGTEVTEPIVYTATCGTVVNGNWNTAACEDGSKQVVTATVTIGGKAYSDTKTVTVDASAPTVQITSPNTGTDVTVNPVKVNLTATDAVSGVATVVLEASRDGGAYEQVGVLTTASGEITWAPSNGSYTLRATATDRTGNRNTTTVTHIQVKLTSSDKTAPTINGLEILNKAASGVERGTVTAQVTATDADSGVAKVELFDGGTSLGVQTAGVGGKYTFTLDTTKLSDGAHALRAVATDNVGLSSQTSLTIQTDNTAPAVTWLSPSDGSIVGGTVNLNATTNEGTLQYAVDGAPVTGTTYTFKADGAHTITASATDKAGNTTTSSIKVTSDATAPTAQITSPAQGATITSNPVTVSVSGSDSLSGVKSLEVFANGTSIGTVNGESGTVTWAPQSGDYALTVIATDKAGNRSTAGTPVNVKMRLATADTTRPVFLTTPTLQPAPQNGLSRGNVVLDGNVTDAETGISTVTLFDGGVRLSATPSLSKNPDGSTRYAFTFDTRTLSDGPHTLVVQATNGVGLTENKEVAVNIDNTAPALSWNAPSFVGASGTLLLEAVSNEGDVTYAASCGEVVGKQWNYSACADGTTAVLTASAKDAAGNVTVTTRSITVDKGAPTVQITSPQDGQKFTSNPITINVTGTDNMDVDSIEVYVNEVKSDKKIGTVTGNQGSLTWAPPSGKYTLIAVATDRARNTSTQDTKAVEVNLTTSDNIAPTGEIKTNLTKAVKGLVNVEVAASDTGSGVATVQLYADGSLIGTQTTGMSGTYAFTFDTTKLTDGDHKLQAVLTDNAGNRATTPESVLKVNNTAPVVTITNPVNGSLLGKASDRTVAAIGTDTTPGDKVTLDYSVDGGAYGTTAPTLPETNGPHTVTVRGTDSAGNVSTATSTVTVDTEAPTVQITSPQMGQKFTSNPITVNVTATDNIGVDHIDVFSGTTKIGTVVGNQGAVVWAPTTGTHTLTAVATDRASNSTTSERTEVQVSLTTSDITPPKINGLKIEGEAVDETYHGAVTALVTAADEESGIAKVELFDGGTSLGMQTVGVNGTYTFTVDTTRLSNGSHNLRAVATNNAGISSETSLTVKVDNTSPVVAWQSPKDGSLVRGTVTLQANTDKGVLTYTVDGKPVAAGSHTFEADGVHTLTAMSTYAGKTTTSTITVTSDATAPTAQIITPTSDQKFTTAPVNVEVRALDTGTGVADITVYALPAGGTEELVGTLKASGSLPWYPTKTDGTPYTLRVVATDRVGNANDSSLAGASAANITVQTASIITFNQEVSLAKPATEPAGGLSSKYVRGPLIVSANATTNAVSGMKQAELLIDGAVKAAETDSQNNPTFNFDFDTLNDGTYNVAVRFTDNVGTVRMTKTDVYVDKTAPVISWNTPAQGSTTNKNEVSLNAMVTDNASGLKGIEFSENGVVVDSSKAFKEGDHTATAIASKMFAEGSHTVTATSIDMVGNRSTQVVSFTVDTTGPVITVSSPTNAQEFSNSPIIISANATDTLSNVKNIKAEIKLGNKIITTVGPQNGNQFNYQFTPTETGIYDITFTSEDTVGNVTSKSLTFKYSGAIEQAPRPALEITGSGPYTGSMNVRIFGNFDSMSEVDKLVLEVEQNGNIDNSSYVSTERTATFSVDTTKLSNGRATLTAIAYTKSGKTVRSTSQTIEVQNELSPVLTITAPVNGAEINTPYLPVRATLTMNGNTPFSFPTERVQMEIIDSRGMVAVSAPDVLCISSPDKATYTCDYTFDIAALPADTYTVRTTAVVGVNGKSQTLVARNQFKANTTSVLPPAATIRFPAITSLRAPARIDSSSGIMVNVSDNTGVAVVEARIVGPFDATKPLTPNGTVQCLDSVPVGNPNNAVNVLLLNQGFSPLISLGDVILPNLDIDGSAYVPDNDLNANERYDLRVTVVDSEGNRNIQCIPVTINRAAMKVDRDKFRYEATATTSPTSANTAPGELNYLSGKWTLTGLTNSSRVAGVLYVNGVQKNISFNADATGSADVTVSFGDEGVYSINWLVEDMTTGIVTSVAGPSVTVKKNKE